MTACKVTEAVGLNASYTKNYPPALAGVKQKKKKVSEITLFLVQEVEDSSTAQDGTGALNICIVRPGPMASSVSPVLSENKCSVFSGCSRCKLLAYGLFIYLG